MGYGLCGLWYDGKERKSGEEGGARSKLEEEVREEEEEEGGGRKSLSDTFMITKTKSYSMAYK